MDWSRWATEIQPELWRGGPDGPFRQFFAPGATYEDPVNAVTEDLDGIEEMTRRSYPDWSQEITSVHGDEAGGSFEWIGRGHLVGKTPMEIHGATVVDIDEHGRITRWRDYFDLREIEAQLGSTMAPPDTAPDQGD
jgi:limonene-1,2-epoxide hydrolase